MSNQEQYLKNLYKRILKIKLINTDDDFFKLGGDSIDQMEIISEISKQYNIQLSDDEIMQHPTIGQLSKRINHILQSKSIEQKKAKKRGKKEEAPLLPSQKQIFALHQLSQDKSVCNIYRGFKLAGPIDDESFLKAIQRVHNRYEALSAKINTQENEEAKQSLDTNIEPNYEKIELSTLKKNEKEKQLASTIEKEIRHSFDLSEAPLYRARLIKTSDEEHVFVLVMHHIIADGWSVDLYLKEISTEYNKIMSKNDLEDRKDHDATPFLNYAAKNIEESNAPDSPSTRRSDLLHSLCVDLTQGKSRPSDQSHKGKRKLFVLPQKTHARVAQLSKELSSTPYIILLASFNILLHIFSNQRKISIGTPYANRANSGSKNIIGPFVETLIILSEFETNSSFIDLIQETKINLKKSIQNKKASYERMLDKSITSNQKHQEEKLNIMFNFLNAEKALPKFKNILSSFLHLDNKTSKYELSAWIWKNESSYTFTFEYNSELFEDFFMQNMLDYYPTLIERFLKKPSKLIKDQLHLTDLDSKKISLWNKTNETFPSSDSLYQLFEKTAKKNGDHTALYFNDQTITYSELAKQVDLISSSYIKNGLQKNDIVLIYMPRSVEAIACMLAAWKCGMAFLAVETNQPLERVSFIINDSKPKAGIAKSQEDIKIIAKHTKSLCYHSILKNTEIEHFQSSADPGPEDPAYIIYTSGSTGNPNGILATHTSTLNRMNWMWQNYPFGKNSISCQKTSFMFVDSIWEIFGPLLSGTPQVLIPEDTLLNMEKFFLEIKKREITHIILIPALLEEILRHLASTNETLDSLKMCSVSGALLSSALAREFFEHLDCDLLHLYGTAEVAGDATAYKVNPKELSLHSDIPLGKPISNTRVHVLNNDMKPVPIGVIGEIYISGNALSKGYISDKNEEQKKFIRAELDGETTLFKTGDLGKYSSTGDLRFSGRKNRQIKIRGIRIELGEIERTIQRHSNIKECAVLYNKESNLFAYCSLSETEENKAFSERDLLKFLSARLIPSMIPQRFIFLESMPTLSTGKINYIELEKSLEKNPKKAIIEPKTKIQSQLALIWSDILDLEEICLSDNFFSLGGHSLLIMRLANAIQKQFNKSVDYRELFENLNLVDMASLIESLKEDSPLEHIPSIRKREKIG